MSSSKERNSSTDSLPVSGFYPRGLLSRVNWKPVNSAGTNGILDRVSGHVEPFVKTTGRLMNFYNSFGVNFRSWPLWDRLSLSYGDSGESLAFPVEDNLEEHRHREKVFNPGIKAEIGEQGKGLSPYDFIALSYELTDEDKDPGKGQYIEKRARVSHYSFEKKSVDDRIVDDSFPGLSGNKPLLDYGEEKGDILVREIIGKSPEDAKYQRTENEFTVQSAGENNSLFSNFFPDKHSRKFDPAIMNLGLSKTVRKEVPGGFPVDNLGAVNNSSLANIESTGQNTVPQQKNSTRVSKANVFENENDGLIEVQNTMQIAPDQSNEFIEKLHDFSKPPVSLDSIDINILNNKKTIKDEIEKSGEQIKMDIQNNIAENVHNIRATGPKIDIDEIANKVSRKLEQKQRLERERKGY